MFKSLWRRFRESNERAARRKDEAAKEQFLLEHESAERDKRSLPGIEPNSSNPDWSYIPPP